MRPGGLSLIPFSESDASRMLVQKLGLETYEEFSPYRRHAKVFRGCGRGRGGEGGGAQLPRRQHLRCGGHLDRTGVPAESAEDHRSLQCRASPARPWKRTSTSRSCCRCPIAVYTEGGKTFISTMRPSALVALCPASGLEQIAAEVEKVVLQIVDEAARVGSLPSEREGAIVLG